MQIWMALSAVAQFIYDTENWFYEKKNSNFFQIYFHFFLVIWTPFTHKKFFCTFGPKITYFYILGGQNVL